MEPLRERLGRQGGEDLTRRHLHGIDAEPRRHVLAERIGDAGIVQFLLFRRPVLVAAVAVETAQRHHVRRVGRPAGFFLPLAGEEYPEQDTGESDGPDGSRIRQQFSQGQRVADLRLDVVRDECRGVHRHRPHVEDLRIEHERVHAVRAGSTQHHDRRQFVHPRIEGCEDDAGIDVVRLRSLPAAVCPDGVGQPGRKDLHAVAEAFGIIRQGEARAFRDAFQMDPVAQLVGDQHGIPRLELLQERALHGHDHPPPRLRGSRQDGSARHQGGKQDPGHSSHHDFPPKKAIRPRT